MRLAMLFSLDLGWSWWRLEVVSWVRVAVHMSAVVYVMQGLLIT